MEIIADKEIRDLYYEMYVTAFKKVLGVDLNKKSAIEFNDAGLTVKDALDKFKIKSSIKRKGLSSEDNITAALAETIIESKGKTGEYKKHSEKKVIEIRQTHKKLIENNQPKDVSTGLQITRIKIRNTYKNLSGDLRELNRIYNKKIISLKKSGIDKSTEDAIIDEINQLYCDYIEKLFKETGSA